MELKEYLRIIKKNISLYVAIIIVVTIAGLGYFYLRSPFYNASLMFNISRQGSQSTDQFKYDDFYRLQADEKFAETVVQWLKDPRIVTDIFTSAGFDVDDKSISQLQKSLKAEKLSSQVVSVSFSMPDKKSAEKLSHSITGVISKTTENLNSKQREETWFEIIPQEPVIVKYQPAFKLIFLGSILIGIFVGFWIVMGKHYLE